MEITQLFTTLLVLACGAFGWFGRMLFSETKALKNQINKLEVLLCADYVKYDRFQDAIHPLVIEIGELRKEIYRKQ